MSGSPKVYLGPEVDDVTKELGFLYVEAHRLREASQTRISVLRHQRSQIDQEIAEATEAMDKATEALVIARSGLQLAEHRLGIKIIM